jgi:hypothetical protein
LLLSKEQEDRVAARIRIQRAGLDERFQVSRWKPTLVLQVSADLAQLAVIGNWET